MANDPDYKETQHNSQRKWQEEHPDYWRQYHKKQRQGRQKEYVHQSVKMDALEVHFHLIPGKYQISLSLSPDFKMDAFHAEIIEDPSS
jgi:hypothetical protein